MSDPRPKVLVVEDGLLYRRAMTLMAEEMGMDVAEASSVSEALEKLSGISLLILDMKLPDGTGSDVLKKLDELDSDVPVIVASGYPEMKNGVSHKNIVIWLNKPFGRVEFRDAIQRAVEVTRQVDTLRDNNRRLQWLVDSFARAEISKPV